MSKLKNNLKIFIFLSILTQSVFAQSIKLQYGSASIALNEPFTISLVITGLDNPEYSDFPDITNFDKVSITTANSQAVVNGKSQNSLVITQNYLAFQQGTFNLNSFKMYVGEKTLTAPPIVIKVGPPDEKKAKFIKQNELIKKPSIELISKDEDAFFMLSTNKDEVFQGESLMLTLAFYKGIDDDTDIQFTDLDNQLLEILKKIKPSNCWEEDFNLKEVQKSDVTIQGKSYKQYKIYQANFYPLSNKDIVFSSVSLKMLKKNDPKSKNDKVDDSINEDGTKSYRSNEKKIKVKALPEHPLQDKIVVGNLSLTESITKIQLQTGENCQYIFQVSGDCNWSALLTPDAITNAFFEIYPTDIEQNTLRTSNGPITGTKKFIYTIIPKQAGTYPLKDIFQLIYFNPTQRRYDTLNSSIVVKVTGERLTNIFGTSKSDFYRDMLQESNNFLSFEGNLWLRRITNGIVFFLLTLLIILALNYRT